MTVKEFSIAQLRSGFKGQVITPEDEAYEAGRQVFYGGIDNCPAVIVRPVDASDVASIVSVARETGMELAIRSGGHSVAGHSATNGGILLDMGSMKALEIDAAAQTMWAETGLTAGEVTTAAAAHGLAIGFGDTGSVGIGGITLGGGVGFLVRKHGLTIDNLLAAEIVTADGQLRRVDAKTHPDLFWTIRGGGGNFGVVTRLQFQLHPLKSIVGGMLFLPATPEIIRDFIAAAEAAPEELSTIANVMVAPPMPFIPAEAHGKLIVMAMLVYAGDTEAGERVIAPFRALATPLADMIKPMTYPEMFPPEEAAAYHPVAASRNMFIHTVDLKTAETIVEHLKASTGMMSVTQLRVLGGAMARVPAAETAYAHRDSKIMVNVAVIYNNPDEKATHEAWAGQFAAALHQGDTGVYMNFLGDEGEARLREAYPGGTWERLREIKAQYDPENVFRRNHNIPAAV